MFANAFFGTVMLVLFNESNCRFAFAACWASFVPSGPGTSLVPINSIRRYCAVAVGIYWYQDFGEKKTLQAASNSETTKWTIFLFFWNR